MSYLLDTHTALWWWLDDSRLSSTARTAIEESVEVYFSSISGYEIALKHRLGKLNIPLRLADRIAEEVSAENWTPLVLNLETALIAGKYPQPHRDPFDRILAAQCEIHSLTLITKDRAFDDFPIATLW